MILLWILAFARAMVHSLGRSSKYSLAPDRARHIQIISTNESITGFLTDITENWTCSAEGFCKIAFFIIISVTTGKFSWILTQLSFTVFLVHYFLSYKHGRGHCFDPSQQNVTLIWSLTPLLGLFLVFAAFPHSCYLDSSWSTPLEVLGIRTEG